MDLHLSGLNPGLVLIDSLSAATFISNMIEIWSYKKHQLAMQVWALLPSSPLVLNMTLPLDVPVF